jgi:hypothetical protein
LEFDRPYEAANAEILVLHYDKKLNCVFVDIDNIRGNCSSVFTVEVDMELGSAS